MKYLYTLLLVVLAVLFFANPVILAIQTSPVSPPMMQTQASSLNGKILESIDSGAYTYLRLKISSGEIWAAVPKSVIQVGSEVVIENPMTMDGFSSPTLKRKFERIVFGSLQGTSSGTGPTFKSLGKELGPDSGNPHGKTPEINPALIENIKIKKAEGPLGKTIAEIFSEKNKIKDQNVLVRGKVVKFSAMIMGKNWVHLRDGTGKAEDKTHDLTLSTQSVVKVGDVALFRGNVALDKNIGAGYFYPVLIENAVLAK